MAAAELSRFRRISVERIRLNVVDMDVPCI